MPVGNPDRTASASPQISADAVASSAKKRAMESWSAASKRWTLRSPGETLGTTVKCPEGPVSSGRSRPESADCVSTAYVCGNLQPVSLGCFLRFRTSPGPRNIWEHIEGQRKASKVPERAISLDGGALAGGSGFTENLALGGGHGPPLHGIWVRFPGWPLKTNRVPRDNPAGTVRRSGQERKQQKQKRRESPRAVVTSQVEWYQ
jgi:hypothetical protein